MPDAFIIAARRTPIASRSRALSALTVDALAARAIEAVLADAPAVTVADVVLGNCMGPGGNPARLAALAAGLGVGVTGSTVDRQCGSGLAAIIDAATSIRAGDSRARLAGGAESASTAPTRSVDGIAHARAPFAPDGWLDPDMPEAADDLAVALGISRERQDAFAARSIERAVRAQFFDELVPDLGPDELLSPSTIDAMPRFRPLRDGGTVTGGNSSRISDGAAIVLVSPSHTGRALRLVSHAIVGCEPALPGIGAAPAITAALESAGLSIEDVAAFEIVEAFAAQSLAVVQTLGLADDDPRVCADGGALALGHPWGASSAVSVVRLFSRLVREGSSGAGVPGSIGVAAASVGGGMGVAAVFEVVE